MGAPAFDGDIERVDEVLLRAAAIRVDEVKVSLAGCYRLFEELTANVERLRDNALAIEKDNVKDDKAGMIIPISYEKTATEQKKME